MNRLFKIVSIFLLVFLSFSLTSCSLFEGSIGPKGDQGEIGPEGPAGPAGINGLDGINGIDGVDGLNGLDGINGIDGVDGLNGKSAFELYVQKYGYEGTELEWLEDLLNGNLEGITKLSYNVNFIVDGVTVLNLKADHGSKIEAVSNPVKEGYTFDGWFVNDDKWSFVGYIVTEDINLIAKFSRQNSLGIDFSDKVFIYDGTPKTLEFTGQLPDGLLHSYSNNSFTNPGVYEVTVYFYYKENPNLFVETITAKLTILAEKFDLDAPVLTIDENKLIWNNVENADKYLVNINDDEIEVLETEFIIPEKHFQAEFTATVKSLSNSSYFGDSIYSNEIIKIGEVSTITLEGNLITINEVEHATSYLVTVGLETFEIFENSFTLENILEDIIVIKIKALTNKNNMLDGSEKEFTLERLEAPEEINLINNRLEWNKVSGSNGYILNINNTEYEVSTNSYSVKDELLDVNIIKIYAVGDNNYFLNSNYSEEFTFNKLSSPVIIYNDDEITWEEVEHATSYHLYINNIFRRDLEGELKLTDISQYGQITIVAVASNNYFNSNKSNVINKLAMPVINESIKYLGTNRLFSWGPVLNAANYNIIIDGKDHVLASNTTSYNLALYEGFDVKIQAIANEGDINSEINELIFYVTEDNQDYVYMGRYPQTVVSDLDLINNLDLITKVDEFGYKEFEGNLYKELEAYQNSGAYYSSGKKVVTGEKDYFKVEPIKWVVLGAGSAFYELMTDLVFEEIKYELTGENRIIDDKIVTPSNYYHSDFRHYLNNDFHNKAFSKSIKSKLMTALVNNSAISFGGSTTYQSPNTNDKVYALSSQDYERIVDKELVNYKMLLGRASDYSKATNVQIRNDLVQYRLRSPANHAVNVKIIDHSPFPGQAPRVVSGYPHAGVGVGFRPVIRINKTL